MRRHRPVVGMPATVNDPIFVLGCPRSGGSIVAGLLHVACGVSMPELLPPTTDHPFGCFEARAVVDAHREILRQVERDSTCPPSVIQPELLDLDVLRAAVDVHRELDGVWAVKEPASMFLLDAWAHLGIDRARLIAVTRTPFDIIRSIEAHDGIRQDRAEAIVDNAMRRLAEIARSTRLPLVHFSNDGPFVLRQVHDLAVALELPWDQSAAESLFDARLVRHRSPHEDTIPAYDDLAAVAASSTTDAVTSVDLRSLRLHTGPERPLETHLGERSVQQRRELWQHAPFPTVPEPRVVEIVLEGSPPGPPHRAAVRDLRRLEVSSPLEVGAMLLRQGLRPDGLIANGLFAGRSESDIEYCLRSLYVTSSPFSELVVDVPDISPAVAATQPLLSSEPRPETLRELAATAGWDHVSTGRLSPGRVAMRLRKHVSTDTELLPAVTELLTRTDAVRSVGAGFAVAEEHGEEAVARPDESATSATELEQERSRAERAERDLRRLRKRRSVRFALAVADRCGALVRAVRS